MTLSPQSAINQYINQHGFLLCFLREMEGSNGGAINEISQRKGKRTIINKYMYKQYTKRGTKLASEDERHLLFFTRGLSGKVKANSLLMPR